MKTLVASGPGIGDALVLTALVWEWWRQRGEQVRVASAHPELFRHHPGVADATYLGMQPCSFPELHDQGAIPEHNIAHMCRMMALEAPTAIRPRLFLTPDELRMAALLLPDRAVTIHPQPGPWTRNKDWPWDRWQALVPLLPGAVVQVGGPDDPDLGVRRLTHLSPRQCAAVIACATLHVCPVTGTMHMAAAVGTPAVVLWSGREDPAITGYASQVNVRGTAPCAPCWLVAPCPHAPVGEWRLPCMSSVTVEVVLDAVRKDFDGNIRGNFR